MFGIDWDGDGEEGLFDDMVTLDLIEDDEKDDYRGGGKTNGSCLMFLVCMGAAIATPIALITKIIV